MRGRDTASDAAVRLLTLTTEALCCGLLATEFRRPDTITSAENFMKARLLVLALLAAGVGCTDTKQPTEPLAPTDASKLISDGANGGNPDFFFLPPLVKNPVNNPNYEAGHFNPTLQPVLTVEICLLQAAPVDAQGLPVVTDCVAGPPVKKFAAGTVRLQNPPDGSCGTRASPTWTSTSITASRYWFRDR
jgi:hypothetical protein